MDDLISRQAAIGRIEKKLEEVYGYTKTEYSEGYVNACHAAEKMLNSLPSVQPNTSNTLESLDCIDRQAALDALKRAEALTRTLGNHIMIYTIQELPSAQPEIIRCKDCVYWNERQNAQKSPEYKKCRKLFYTRADDFCSWAERRQDE